MRRVRLKAGGLTALEQCRLFIKETWSTELELDEVRSARDRLVQEGRAEQAGGGLALTDVTRAYLDQEREAWEAAERTAVEEWEAAVREEFPLLAEEDVAALRDQLRPWLRHVIARHGAEASVLLYPGHERSERILDSFAATGLDFLPDCGPDLNAVRVGAFRLFVREPTTAQREYLGRLLNTAFYVTVLSLDPKARHLVSAEAKQTVLYLDTNFLYSVLGVGGTTEAHAATRLLELCRELGYSLRVTPWTVDELRTSIARSKSDVGRMHQSRKSATVMAQVTGEKGFVTAYWRELRDHGTGPADFFGKYDHFMRYLQEHGIEEHPEDVREVEEDLEGIRRYASPLEAMFGVGAKHREVIEHDAKTRLLIERLRGSSQPPGYTDVHHWFLTESTRLPTYARMPIDSPKRPDYPFCILSSTWAQIVRALTPRTPDDLNDVMVGLLASPYVGYRVSLQGTARKAVDRVVSRIDSLKDVPPRVAIALVNDGAMAKKIGEETDEEEVDRLIDENLTLKAQELEDRVAETARRAAAAERKKAEAEERAQEALEDLEATKAETTAELERARHERAALAAEQSAATERLMEEAARTERKMRDDISKAEAGEAAQREARTQAEERAKQLGDGIAIAVAFCVAVASVTVLATGTIEERVPVILLISGATATILAALTFLSSTLAKRVVLILTVFLGVAQVLAALWPAEDPGDRRRTNSPDQTSRLHADAARQLRDSPHPAPPVLNGSHLPSGKHASGQKPHA